MTAQANPQKNKDFFYYFISFIGIAVMFGFGQLPASAPLTQQGMNVVGIFLGVLILWTFIGLLWPSLLAIAAICLVGGVPMGKVMAGTFGDKALVMVFLSMILFGAFQHYGVTRYISTWFLTRKMINGKPGLFNFVFFYTTYILAALSANILPTILFMWAIIYGILEEVGYKKGDAYSNIMVTGVLFSAVVGQAAKPFTGSVLLILGSYENVSKATMDYLDYMSFGFVICSLIVVCYSLVVKYILRPDMSKIAGISVEQINKNPLPPMDTRQRILFGCLFGFLIMVLLPSFLPASFPLVPALKKLGPWGIALVFIVGVTLFKVNGKPIMDFKEIAAKYVGWDVYALVAFAMFIGPVLLAPETGVSEYLKSVFIPLFEGRSSYVATMIMIVGGILITQVANNAIMGAMLMPVIGVVSAQVGSNFAGTAALMTFAMHLAFLTPAASPYAAVLYANTDWLEKKAIMKYSLIFVFMSICIYGTVAMPLMNMIFPK